MAASMAGAAARRRILIVDDNEDIRLLLRLNLQEAFIVDEAHSAALALSRIEAGEEFDVVITDVIQPGMDGIELTERLRDGKPALPVIVLSAWITKKNAHVALDAGAKVAMAKPFRADELVATLVNVLA